MSDLATIIDIIGELQEQLGDSPNVQVLCGRLLRALSEAAAAGKITREAHRPRQNLAADALIVGLYDVLLLKRADVKRILRQMESRGHWQLLRTEPTELDEDEAAASAQINDRISQYGLKPHNRRTAAEKLAASKWLETSAAALRK